MLAAMMRAHPDELRADLQETYGVDIDRAMAGEHSAYHVGVLAAQLPRHARVRIAEDEDCAWRLEHVIMAQVLNEFRAYEWALADRRKRGPRPEPIGPSYMRPQNKLPAMAMPISALMAQLEMDRREA